MILSHMISLLYKGLISSILNDPRKNKNILEFAKKKKNILEFANEEKIPS